MNLTFRWQNRQNFFFGGKNFLYELRSGRSGRSSRRSLVFSLSGMLSLLVFLGLGRHGRDDRDDDRGLGRDDRGLDRLPGPGLGLGFLFAARVQHGFLSQRQEAQDGVHLTEPPGQLGWDVGAALVVEEDEVGVVPLL